MASHPAGSKPSTAAAPLLCVEISLKYKKMTNSPSSLRIAQPKQTGFPHSHTHTLESDG